MPRTVVRSEQDINFKSGSKSNQIRIGTFFHPDFTVGSGVSPIMRSR
jgi:hypothetical protein